MNGVRIRAPAVPIFLPEGRNREEPLSRVGSATIHEVCCGCQEINVLCCVRQHGENNYCKLFSNGDPDRTYVSPDTNHSRTIPICEITEMFRSSNTPPLFDINRLRDVPQDKLNQNRTGERIRSASPSGVRVGIHKLAD